MKRNNILEARRAHVSKETRESIDFSFEIVDRIHDILQSKRMTQKDLSLLLDKNEAEISKWMRGTHNFTITTIKKIELALDAKILGIVPKEPERIIIILPNPSGYTSYDSKKENTPIYNSKELNTTYNGR